MTRRDDTFDLSPEQETVYQAVAQVESAGEPGHLQQIAQAAGLDQDRTRAVLSELINRFDLVTEMADTGQPDFGPRYVVPPSD